MTEINLCNEVLKNAIGVHRSLEKIEPLNPMDAVTVQAMEELLKYRAIGTVEECRVAVELMKKLNDRKMTVEVLENYMQFEDECVKMGYSFKSILEARERMKPKKPKSIDEDYGTFICSNCGHTIIALDDMTIHKNCLMCGQAIDWQ